MSQPLTERYDDRIAGRLSCYDRLVISYASACVTERQRWPPRRE